MKLLLVMLLPSLVLANTEIQEAKQSIEALIQPLMAGTSKKHLDKKTKFRADDCGKQKINWIGMLFESKSATLEFKFKEGCDIQGKIQPKLLHDFPANLDLRNLKSYNRVETMNKITADLQVKPILNLEMRKGVLKGPHSLVKFEADYKVRISPTSEKSVDDNMGGVLRITEINGKKVNIHEKIMVK